jgi:hypothetical protein
MRGPGGWLKDVTASAGALASAPALVVSDSAAYLVSFASREVSLGPLIVCSATIPMPLT